MGSWKSSKGRTVGNGNPILQLMGPQALRKVGEDHIEGPQHMFGFGYPLRQYNINRS